MCYKRFIRVLSCWSNSISNYFLETQWTWIKDTICSDHSDPKPIFCDSTHTPPTPTPPAPTTPRDCTNPNKYLFEVEIVTDAYASQDTSFKVKRKNKRNKFGKKMLLASLGSLPDNETVTYSKCLPRKKCYKLFMYDSYGDGLCCLEGNGSYTAYWNGKCRLTLWFIPRALVPSFILALLTLHTHAT